MMPFRAALLSSAQSPGGTPPLSSVVGVTTAERSTGGTTLDIDVPAAAAAGDMLLIELNVNLTIGSITPTGLVKLREYSSVGSQVTTIIYGKMLEASDLLSTIGLSWTTNRQATAIAVALRDVGMIDFITTVPTNDTGTTVAHASGTTYEDDELLLLFLGVNHGTNSTTEPSGTTHEATIGTSTAAGGSRTALASIRQALAGGTSAYAWTTGANYRTATKIALRGPITGAPPAGAEYVGGKVHSAAALVGGQQIIPLNDLTGGSDTSVRPGDFIFLSYSLSINSSTPRTMVADRFHEESYVIGVDSMSTHLSVQCKFADEFDAFVFVPNTGSSSAGFAVAIEVWRGIDPTTPIASKATANGNNTGQANPPAVTPSVSGQVVVAAGGGGYLAINDFTSSDLSNFKKIQSSGATFPSQVGMGHIVWSGSGSVDPAQWGGGTTNSNASWAAGSYVLNPAP